MELKRNVELDFKEDIDLEYLLNKYGNEDLFKIGKIIQKYSIKNAFKAIEESINNIETKKYNIVKYSSGDFGDLGSVIGYIDAENKEGAWLRLKERYRLSDSDKSYYSITEIKNAQ